MLKKQWPALREAFHPSLRLYLATRFTIFFKIEMSPQCSALSILAFMNTIQHTGTQLFAISQDTKIYTDRV